MSAQARTLALLLVAAMPAQGLAVPLLAACDEGLAGWLHDADAAYAAHPRTPAAQAAGVRESCASSARQVRALQDGSLPADVAVLAQPRDLDSLASGDGPVAPGWRTLLPDDAAPVATVVVFLVRHGNPKAIHDWPDLVRPGVTVPVPDPKLTSDGRLVYYAAWGGIQRAGGTAGQSRALVARLFRNAPVLDGGTPAAAAAFARRGTGDAIVVLEQQVEALRADFGRDLDVVVPPHTLLVAHPVAVLDRAAERHGTRDAAQAWARWLWSDEAQELAARHGLRPRSAKVLAVHRQAFPATDAATLDTLFGGWSQAQQAHFGDGGVWDQIVLGVKRD